MKQLMIATMLLLTGIGKMAAQNADVMKSDAIMQESKMQYLAAAELYEKAAGLYEADGKTDAFSLFKAGQNYTKAKNYEKALELLDKAKANGYSDVQMNFSYGDAYAGLNRFEDAEKVLMEGKELYAAENNEFVKKLGYLYFNSDQYEKAIGYLKVALALEPDNYSYHYLLGSSYERTKDYQQAIEELEKVVALSPGHKNSIKKLGVIHFKQTDYLYEKETKRYESLKAPNRVDYHNSTKKLEAIAQGYRKALPYLEQSYEFSPSDKAIISCLSVAYRRLKMDEKAAKMAELLK